jgi:hypothetical protein
MIHIMWYKILYFYFVQNFYQLVVVTHFIWLCSPKKKEKETARYKLQCLVRANIAIESKPNSDISNCSSDPLTSCTL